MRGREKRVDRKDSRVGVEIGGGREGRKGGWIRRGGEGEEGRMGEAIEGYGEEDGVERERSKEKECD